MYLFLDVETTGLNTNENDPLDKRAKVIQLAYSVYDNNRNMISCLNTLIKPEGWNSIDPGAFKVHGISIEDCHKLGVPLKHAIGVFHHHAELSEYFVAHNIKYDYKLMKFCYEKLGILDKFPTHLKKICTMECSKGIVKARTKTGALKNPRLEECVSFFFDRPIKNYHNALTDVLECKNVFFRLQDEDLVSINNSIT